MSRIVTEFPDEEFNDFQILFDTYAKFGNRESDRTITLKNIDKWLKQADLLDRKGGVSNADTAITFSRIAKSKKRMDFEEFQEFIEILAYDKKVEPQEFVGKLIAAGEPRVSSVTLPVTSGAVGRNLRRLTDTKLYTGAHKSRFDEEGRGKGLEGRRDISPNTGYVNGFKKHDKDEDKKKKK